VSKEQFRTINFRPAARARIDQINEIIDDYQQQGLKLTARQLYYQFVSKELIPNSQVEYKKLTSLLTDARYAGMVDWSAIEDRGREASSWAEYDSIEQLVRSAIRTFRLPRWAGQHSYSELWVEKQALAGVLEPIAMAYHATLVVNKGYSSASAMKESADRIMRSMEDGGHQEANIFYLGDHDPSGEDMVRDIEERLDEFGVHDLAVLKVALTTPQVKQYKPPPNPAKLTDPRAAGYIARHGQKSWELDAIPPQVLAQLVRQAFDAVIDDDKMQAIKDKEAKDKTRLLAAVAKIK